MEMFRFAVIQKKSNVKQKNYNTHTHGMYNTALCGIYAVSVLINKTKNKCSGISIQQTKRTTKRNVMLV